MATASLNAPGGRAAAEYIQDRFGIQWGPDVFGIAEDGFTAESVGSDGGQFKLTLVGRCTRADVEKIIGLLWEKEKP